MSDLTLREQSLVDALNTRLVEADALTTDGILKEIEESPQYMHPSDPDHLAYLHMLPLAVGRQMELRGEDPHTPAQPMLDNQKFTHEIFPQEKPIDFTGEDEEYNTKRKNLARYTQDIQDDKITVPDLTKQNLLDGAQSQLIELDTEQDTRIKSRETELDRMDKQESEWEQEEAKRRIQIKDDFMADRLKNALPDDKKKLTELAETEWQRLQTEYGF